MDTPQPEDELEGGGPPLDVGLALGAPEEVRPPEAEEPLPVTLGLLLDGLVLPDALGLPLDAPLPVVLGLLDWPLPEGLGPPLEALPLPVVLDPPLDCPEGLGPPLEGLPLPVVGPPLEGLPLPGGLGPPLDRLPLLPGWPELGFGVGVGGGGVGVGEPVGGGVGVGVGVGPPLLAGVSDVRKGKAIGRCPQGGRRCRLRCPEFQGRNGPGPAPAFPPWCHGRAAAVTSKEPKFRAGRPPKFRRVPPRAGAPRPGAGPPRLPRPSRLSRSYGSKDIDRPGRPRVPWGAVAEPAPAPDVAAGRGALAGYPAHDGDDRPARAGAAEGGAFEAASPGLRRDAFDPRGRTALRLALPEDDHGLFRASVGAAPRPGLTATAAEAPRGAASRPTALDRFGFTEHRVKALWPRKRQREIEGPEGVIERIGRADHAIEAEAGGKEGGRLVRKQRL